ncbi:LysE family translocator [Actinoplanes sp. NPDC051859]|uniref:LysE family translocator n=1 Tax=Actinoplanes sp. NPDC051859 TaxID=3363909 RepID=UPI0037B16F83
MPVHIPAFVLTTLLLAMLPGPGQALMLRQTLTHGRRAAFASIMGTATGLVIWSVAAAAGLSAVLLANPAMYALLRIAGGAILAVLGITTLLALRKPETPPADLGPARSRAWLAGLTTNLGNPKAGVFAISLLPQFVTTDGPVFLSNVALGAIWALVTAAWYVAFTWAVDRGRAFTSRPAVHRRVQACTGSFLIVLGASVAAGL